MARFEYHCMQLPKWGPGRHAFLLSGSLALLLLLTCATVAVAQGSYLGVENPRCSPGWLNHSYNDSEIVSRLEKIVRENPNDFRAQTEFARALLNACRLEEALFKLEELLHYLSAVNEDDTRRSEVWYLKGLAVRRGGALLDAARYFSVAIQFDDSNVLAYVALAEILTELQEPRRAIDLLLDVIDKVPDSADAHIQLATAYYDLGRYGESRDKAEKAIFLLAKGERADKATKLATAYMLMGNIARDQADIEEAKLNETTSTAPGEIQQIRRLRHEAWESYRIALDEDKGNYQVAREAAQLMRSWAASDEASAQRSDFTQLSGLFLARSREKLCNSIKVSPYNSAGNVGSYLELAKVFGKLGDPDRQLLALRQGLRLFPTDWESQFELGNLLRAKGLTSYALWAYRNAYALDRHNSRYADALKKLLNETKLVSSGLLDKYVDVLAKPDGSRGFTVDASRVFEDSVKLKAVFIGRVNEIRSNIARFLRVLAEDRDYFVL